MAQKRHEVQDFKKAVQQPQAVLIKQQAQVTEGKQQEPRQQSRTEQTWQDLVAKLTARANDGDIIDNKALGQPFKHTCMKISDFALPGILLGDSFGQGKP